MKLIQVDFNFDGPFGSENAERLRELAQSITEEPGFVWKIWTEDAAAGRAGGIYVFEDEKSARAYLTMHRKRLEASGATDIQAKFFDINEDLTAITYGQVTSSDKGGGSR